MYLELNHKSTGQVPEPIIMLLNVKWGELILVYFGGSGDELKNKNNKKIPYSIETTSCCMNFKKGQCTIPET